ncbi:hypothetical protein GQ53DRAFT_37806 [Thozetella sp. PMI_491]|nr:hypothetical protein GQ53DRAFT_37806 [Thozetella sp. PMI_491]
MNTVALDSVKTGHLVQRYGLTEFWRHPSPVVFTVCFPRMDTAGEARWMPGRKCAVDAYCSTTRLPEPEASRLAARVVVAPLPSTRSPFLLEGARTHGLRSHALQNTPEVPGHWAGAGCSRRRRDKAYPVSTVLAALPESQYMGRDEKGSSWHERGGAGPAGFSNRKWLRVLAWSPATQPSASRNIVGSAGAPRRLNSPRKLQRRRGPLGDRNALEHALPGVKCPQTGDVNLPDRQ